MSIELEPGDTLCNQGDAAANIYILAEGHLEVFMRDKRGRDIKISDITEKNSIFGEIGALLKQPRGATIRAASHSLIQTIEVKGRSMDHTILSKPLLGLSISINLARYIRDTNQKLSQYTHVLTETRKVVDEYLLYFFEKSNSIRDLYEQTRFSWAKIIFDKAKSHICYGMAESVSRQQAAVPAPPPAPSSPTLLSSSVLPAAGGKEFKAGEALCREGEEGREIFILLSGSLEVQVGGQKVADIKSTGSVVGEVAVLCGWSSKKFEARTATIIAREDSTAIVIDGMLIEPVINANPLLILFITKVLAERLPVTNHALLAADDQIKKYLALIDPDAFGSLTLINAFDVLRTNLMSHAKDADQTAGYQREVEAKLKEMKNHWQDLAAKYAEAQ